MRSLENTISLLSSVMHSIPKRRRRDASKKRDEKRGGGRFWSLSLLGGQRGTFAFARLRVRAFYYIYITAISIYLERVAAALWRRYASQISGRRREFLQQFPFFLGEELLDVVFVVVFVVVCFPFI